MLRVEYRTLQVMISPLTGDRLTVGLLHWDGDTLRTASSLSPLTQLHPEQRDHIRRTINAKMKRAGRVARGIKEQRTLFNLAQLFPVREGMGSALMWSPVFAGATHNSQAHFEEVRTMARLEHGSREDEAVVTNRALIDRMKIAVARLSIDAPERVRVSNKIRRHQAVTVPISWKNGLWHHALAFSLDGTDEATISKRVRDIVGIVELCVPPEDIPVPIAVLPTDPAMKRVALDGIHAVQECLGTHRVQVVEVPHHDGEVTLDPLMDRIRADVTAA